MLSGQVLKSVAKGGRESGVGAEEGALGEGEKF